MVEQKRGLGRGLSALLEEVSEPQITAQTEAAPRVTGGGMTAPIELLHRNPDQPRRHFDEDEIDSLARSIEQKGLLQPILVRPAPTLPGEFQIVAGERRWRAAQKAKLRTVPIVIRELDDAQTLEIAILENVQRADLNPVEEAAGYRTLMDRFGHTQEDVAQAVGKTRVHVANTIRLLSLPEKVQGLVVEGKLTAGHARAVMTSPDPTALAERVVVEGLNVRQAEALAKAPTEKAPPKVVVKDVNTRDLERRLGEALGLVVEISDRDGAGELRVKYKTLEQLDLVCRKLTAR